MQHGRTNPCMRARSGGASVDNWRDEYSYIFMFTDFQNIRFQKKSMMQNKIYGKFAPPIIEAGYATESA